MSFYLNQSKHKASHGQYRKKITQAGSRALMNLYAGISDSITIVPIVKKEGVQLKLNF
jgi:hypothetical protein